MLLRAAECRHSHVLTLNPRIGTDPSKCSIHDFHFAFSNSTFRLAWLDSSSSAAGAFSVSEIEMTLKGFYMSSWLGWFTGLYFVKKPWGIPKPTNLFSLYTSFALTVWIINVSLWADFQIKTSHIFEELPFVLKILSKLVTGGCASFDLYFRVLMFAHNRRIPSLLAKLEKNRLRDDSAKSLQFCRKYHDGIRWFLLIPRLICPVMIILIFIESVRENEWYFIKPPWYFILLFLFGILPSMFSIIFIYDFIVTTTYETLSVIEHFFESIHKLMVENTTNLKAFQNLLLSSSWDEQENVLEMRSESPSVLNNCKEEHEQIRGALKILLSKFENLKTLCDHYDRTNGYLILGVIARSVFMIIHSIADLIIMPKEIFTPHIVMKLTFDLVMLIIELGQLTLLDLGSKVKDQVRYRVLPTFF
jgi:hypothetical protein